MPLNGPSSQISSAAAATVRRTASSQPKNAATTSPHHVLDAALRGLPVDDGEQVTARLAHFE